MLELYNTLTNQNDTFTPLVKGKATVYTCGPTVYGRPHIGNYSAFIMADLLVRWLEHGHKLEVTHVKNITDVGHLAGDGTADATGEDKIERQAKKEAIDPLGIANKYAAEYIADEQALQMREPQERPYATTYVPQMLTIIKELLQKGYAYETTDGYYFEVQKFKNYGKLSGNTLQNLQAGKRIVVDDQKKHPADFALWKKCIGENSHHILRWNFESGQRVSGDSADENAGFPGWHIECSAMAKACLGDQIDIHTGGEDNIFPHHECEIAQSESCTGASPFAAFWLHRRRINMGDVKMSKSLGNVLNLDDIVKMGFSPLDLKYYFLSVHYRTQLKFTEVGLAGARTARLKIQTWIKNLSTNATALTVGTTPNPIADLDTFKSCRQSFINAMNSDLNTPAALAEVFKCIIYIHTHQIDIKNKTAVQEELRTFADLVKNTFACFEDQNAETKELIITPEVQELLDQRAAARANKAFATSDALRDKFAELGYLVKDTANGQELEAL